MTNQLQAIIQQKTLEVAQLYKELKNQTDHPLSQVLQGVLPVMSRPRFKDALQTNALALIAEIKRQSPSKGKIAPIINPLSLAQEYILGGASALSILTDQKFFAGHMNDLRLVVPYATEQSTPILRKDFMIDKVQIAEAALAGASAILLIVAVLGEKTKELLAFAQSLKLDVLVEIHGTEELRIALDSGAEIIGVNNRNLATMEVDLQHALKIIPLIPEKIIGVAESGMVSPLIARTYYTAGFKAVLIGEALVRSEDPARFIEACCYG